MNNLTRLKIDALQRLCSDKEEESLILEFKPCNELKVGTPFRNRSREEKDRQLEDVLNELTKDVTALLNSTGGIIIYGIVEKKSRAERLDETNSFKKGSSQDDVRPEKVIQWLRVHIQPPPPVNVYSVFIDPNVTDSPWYLIVEVPQGQTAYMAKDHRFHKRVGNITQPMEQYEVIDVTNRTRAAVLDLKLSVRQDSGPSIRDYIRLRLEMAITNNGFIASEHGALKVTLARPAMLDQEINSTIFHGHYVEFATGLILEEMQDIPHAQSIMIRWSANTGIVIFPGETFDFHKNPLLINVPQLTVIADPTCLVQTELFTMSGTSKKSLHMIRCRPTDNQFELLTIDAQNYENCLAAFWKTYHSGLEKLTGR